MINIGSAIDSSHFGAKPLPKPMLIYCQLDPDEQSSFNVVNFFSLKSTFVIVVCKILAFLSRLPYVNSLAPVWCGFKLALVTFIFRSRIQLWIWPRWLKQYLTDDLSTLAHIMAWCRQATSHYLNQCCPSYMAPYGVTRPQWVKLCYS